MRREGGREGGREGRRCEEQIVIGGREGGREGRRCEEQIDRTDERLLVCACVRERFLKEKHGCVRGGEGGREGGKEDKQTA
jgi:hypothetical protein